MRLTYALEEIRALKQDRNVASTIESLLPEPGARHRCLTAFADAIRDAHRQGADKWGITCMPDRVRLVAGSLVVCTVPDGGLWVVLASDYLERQPGLKEQIERSSHWRKHSTGYMVIPSISGYYLPDAPESELTWCILKSPHFSFIEAAARTYQRLRAQSRQSHSEEVLRYIEGALALPSPTHAREARRN
jgi:hypothetical protein